MGKPRCPKVKTASYPIALSFILNFIRQYIIVFTALDTYHTEWNFSKSVRNLNFHGKKCSNLTLKKIYGILLFVVNSRRRCRLNRYVCAYIFGLKLRMCAGISGFGSLEIHFIHHFFHFCISIFFISAWSLYHCILWIFMPCRRSPCCNLWVSFSSFHSLWPKSWFRWSFYTRKKSRKTLPVEFVDS